MNNIFSNKVFWGIVLAGVIGGLGAVTGLVSPTWGGVITIIVTILTGIGHSSNILKGRS